MFLVLHGFNVDSCDLVVIVEQCLYLGCGLIAF